MLSCDQVLLNNVEKTFEQMDDDFIQYNVGECASFNGLPCTWIEKWRDVKCEAWSERQSDRGKGRVVGELIRGMVYARKQQERNSIPCLYINVQYACDNKKYMHTNQTGTIANAGKTKSESTDSGKHIQRWFVHPAMNRLLIAFYVWFEQNRLLIKITSYS